MYNELCHLADFLRTWPMLQKLILKKDKDPLLCGSFRPISLSNVDYKILAKILAICVQQVLPGIISSDQTGFILGWHSLHNTRRLLNILNMPSSSTPEVVVLLDAEKAFHRVEWEFIFEMDRFGYKFYIMGKVVILIPSGIGQTYNVLSPSFQLHSGTRQGCPLSPGKVAFYVALISEVSRITY